ncbi:hypothetical protein Tco_1020653 [Tanacetum coccineum]
MQPCRQSSRNKSMLELKGSFSKDPPENWSANDDQEPSAGTDQGSKRRRAGKEPESSSAPKETTTKSTGQSIEGSKSRHQSTGQSAPVKNNTHEDEL